MPFCDLSSFVHACFVTPNFVKSNMREIHRYGWVEVKKDVEDTDVEDQKKGASNRKQAYELIVLNFLVFFEAHLFYL